MVGKDGDFLDEFFDQILIEPCNVGFLLSNEVLQFSDPVHGLFPVVGVNLGHLFLIAESENLVSDGIVDLLVVDLLDELLLQFIKPCLNAVRRERVGADYGLGDIHLQLLQKGLTLGQNSV